MMRPVAADADLGTSGVVDVADELALVRLLAEYGHIMDERNWSGLDRIFTPDVQCDWSAFDLAVTDGLAHLQEYFDEIRHPIAHHVTNVVAEVDATGESATIRSKLLVVLDDGSVATGDYVDQAVRTPEGWRIRHRVARPRRRPSRR